jgi:hypothetical protein
VVENILQNIFHVVSESSVKQNLVCHRNSESILCLPYFLIVFDFLPRVKCCPEKKKTKLKRDMHSQKEKKNAVFARMCAGCLVHLSLLK